jgi:diguanylate cyclase (GGDEF)-like protein/PAS domain S-box-containing protein
MIFRHLQSIGRLAKNEQKMSFGIRARLIVLVLALLLPFLAYILYSAKTEEKQARARAMEETLVFARLLSARIDDHVSQMGQLLNTLSHAVSVDPAAAASNDKFLRTLKEGLPKFISELAVWTPEGNNIGNLLPVDNRATLSIGNWQFFRETLKKRGWAVEGPFLSRGSREFTMVFTQTVVDAGGRVTGVVSASMRLSEFRDVLGRGTTLPEGTVTALLDPQGIVLARSLNPEIWIGETLIGTKAIRQALTKREGSLELDAEDGVSRLAGFATASQVPWMVYIGTPTDVALAPVEQQLRDRLIMSAIILSGLLLVAIFLGERISKPLRQLADDAKAFGEGALDRRTRVAAGGEVGVLATTLNQMAAAIQARAGELKDSESRLRQSEARLRTIIESEPDCVTVLGRNGHVQEINAAGLKLFEAQALDEVRDKDISAVIVAEYRDNVQLMHRRVIAGETVNFDFELIGLKGTRRWMSCVAAPLPGEGGEVIGQLAIARDITERKLTADRIEHLATRDALTDLPNRALLNDRLQQVLATAHRDGKSLAVMFIDLDRFKNINDSLGHHAGDVLLRETAMRLTVCLRENDTVARQGGDEFIVLLPESDGPAAALVARKILDTITQPVHFDGHELVVQASIGIAIYPENGEEASTLLRNADAAMYYAKAMGRNNYQFFMVQMNETLQLRLLMESTLRRALASNELRLHYQPQITIATGEIAGYEALVRWAHPERGLIAPPEFIHLAEESGLIIALGEWVLREGCRQAAQWQRDGKRLRLAINVSAKQFLNKDFADKVSRILADSGCDPHLLELEITEDTFVKQNAAVLEVMQVLKPLGISLSIDDFGSSYSSLIYLKRLSIRKLKIDPSFIRGLDDADDAAIVRATINLARSLSLEVVAEGIETPAQLNFLRAAGCDLGQGYHIGHPQPVAENLASHA